jgi:hypothetical protein
MTISEVTPETINPDTMEEAFPTGASGHTRQMETDTVTEEREILLQRAKSASNPTEARAVRDQIAEHIELYKADEGVGVLKEQLTKLDTMLGS